MKPAPRPTALTSGPCPISIYPSVARCFRITSFRSQATVFAAEEFSFVFPEQLTENTSHMAKLPTFAVRLHQLITLG